MKKKDPLQSLVKSYETPLQGEEKEEAQLSLDVQDWLEVLVEQKYMVHAGVKDGQQLYKMTEKGKKYVHKMGGKKA